MTRIHHARPQAGPQRIIARGQSRAAHPTKKPYKIVLEAVTQEKKKLHSILTYASNAPTGFGFIPAGNPEFTEWCKEQCRQRNLDVHIVSAKPKNKMHADPEKLSHHVHRVGHHFPIEIVNLACSKFNYTYDEANGLRKSKGSDGINWITQQVEDYSSRQILHGRPSTEKETKNYITGAVREMFPKIPEADLLSIVNHAFEEGTNRVGNAKELSLARRVQLAVVAHIRHGYTDYDKLLKSGGWMEARSKVEHVSLAKLKEWRDEAGEQSNELEETFREVIVLDDDEASSDGDSLSTPDEREQSMEIVSSRATARDLQPERYANYPSVDVHDMRRVPRRTIVAQRYAPPPPVGAPPGPSNGRAPLQPPYEYVRPFEHVSRPSSRNEKLHHAHGRPIDPRMRPAVPQSSPKGAPIMREIDGRLYQLQPIEEARTQPRVVYDSPTRVAPHHAHPGYVQSPVRPSSFDRAPPAHSRRPSEQDVILPSVEPDAVDLTPPRRVTEYPRPPGREYIPRAHAEIQSPKRRALPLLPDSRDAHVEQSNKRPRPVYREDDFHPQAYQNGHSQFPPYQSATAHSRPQAPPPREVVDLTSSSFRPPFGGERGHFLRDAVYPANEPNGHAYATASSRRSPPREVRGAYYDVPAAAPSHAYMPDQRMYERRAPPPPLDYIPLRGDRQRRYVEEESPRYLRSGVKYGG